METFTDIIEDACSTLKHWYDQGRVVPNYRRARGKPYLCWLFSGEIPEINSQYGLWIDLLKPHLTKCKAIAGPHGWAIYQALLIKRREANARLQNVSRKGRLVL